MSRVVPLLFAPQGLPAGVRGAVHLCDGSAVVVVRVDERLDRGVAVSFDVADTNAGQDLAAVIERIWAGRAELAQAQSPGDVLGNRHLPLTSLPEVDPAAPAQFLLHRLGAFVAWTRYRGGAGGPPRPRVTGFMVLSSLMCRVYFELDRTVGLDLPLDGPLGGPYLDEIGLRLVREGTVFLTPTLHQDPYCDAVFTRKDWRRPIDPVDELAAQLGREIHSLRDQRGWSRSQLAVAAGMTPVAIGRFEAGGTVPSQRVYEQLLSALNADRGVEEASASHLDGA